VNPNPQIMPLKTTKDYPDIPDDMESLPRISIIIPFEPRMNKKSELLNVLWSAADKAVTELKENFPEEKAMPVIIKLRRLIEGIHYEEHNKSIAIFVSPVTEKVYYFTYNNFLENYFPGTI
jgi:hypothetical protein